LAAEDGPRVAIDRRLRHRTKTIPRARRDPMPADTHCRHTVRLSSSLASGGNQEKITDRSI
jgi:hypothetical protein